MIERSFENIKYGNYPQNTGFDNLHIECKKDFSQTNNIFLTYNKVKMLKVVLFEISLDIRRYESNNQNVDVYY